ncbi:MAG TPA: hypothetical protein VKT77_00280, partial [Chthonomonadaceae bacterium]|nr:hypothetical protein [Chthonomonadaceae bacterium]
GLMKEAGRYLGALKAWKKACKTGQYNDRQKAAGLAAQLAPALAEPAERAASSFAVDVREYLSGEQWRRDVIEAAASDPIRLRVAEEGDTLVSSPVIVRAQPGRAALQIGRQNWPHLRPRAVAAELKRLRDRTGSANSSEFLESLFAVWNSQKANRPVFIRFREIYEMWSLTPGWKRENPAAKFAQEIYALSRSGIAATRSGRRYEIITPSANAKPAEIYNVIAEDGRTVCYLGIRFDESKPAAGS